MSEEHGQQIPSPTDVSRRIMERNKADSLRLRSRIIGELANATKLPILIPKEDGDHVKPVLGEFQMKGWVIVEDESDCWTFIA